MLFLGKRRKEQSVLLIVVTVTCIEGYLEFLVGHHSEIGVV